MSLSAILNSPLLYALVGGGILIVLVIATIFFLRGRKRALELGVSRRTSTLPCAAVWPFPSSPPLP